MQVVSPELISGKNVLVRVDIDVPIENGKILEPFRLEGWLPTMELCLQHAASTTLMGHIGRPEGKEDPSLSVAPVVEWLKQRYPDLNLEEGKLHIMENLRFDAGEDAADENYAKELASHGDFFVNEAFASHRPSASTTVLPTLLPHAAGLKFAKEVEVLTNARNNPKKPQIAIVGGAKVDDKFEAVIAFSKFCEAVLVGGLFPKQIQEKNLEVDRNVMMGRLAENGIDLSEDSIEAFIRLIKNAKQIIWAGPIGKYEDPEGNKGNVALATALLSSEAEIIVGGGDTIAMLGESNLLDQFMNKPNIFVSSGGGAMLKLLSKGTLPTIEALN
jgi:phosphoglycerate kinase